MPRYKLTIEYDGRPFHGWQSQPGVPTVEQAIEDACFKMTGVRGSIEGSGRTDAGVHALGQVAHVDLPRAYPAHQITGALNHYLEGKSVFVLSAEEIDDHFHARFSATGRQYVYRIINRRSPLALELGRAWHIIKPLNLEAMREAANLLLGTHDFTSFRSIRCQAKCPIRTLELISIEQKDEQQRGLIEINVRSRAFLHNQVRIMVGTLKLVGQGHWTVADVECALAAQDRTRGGPTAPPDGLYFKQVFYGDGASHHKI